MQRIAASRREEKCCLIFIVVARGLPTAPSPFLFDMVIVCTTHKFYSTKARRGRVPSLIRRISDGGSFLTKKSGQRLSFARSSRTARLRSGALCRGCESSAFPATVLGWLLSTTIWAPQVSWPRHRFPRGNRLRQGPWRRQKSSATFIR